MLSRRRISVETGPYKLQYLLVDFRITQQPNNVTKNETYFLYDTKHLLIVIIVRELTNNALFPLTGVRRFGGEDRLFHR